MELRPYSVGRAVPEGVRRLHLNEYRFAHPERVVAVLREKAAKTPAEAMLTNYCARPSQGLSEALARYVGAPSAKNILVAPGSDELLRAAVDLAALRGLRAALMGVPGYTHFAHFVGLRGLGLETYPIGLATAAADHEAALRYHAGPLAEGRLVYLCSPNNPTGDLWGRGAVAALAAEYPRSLFLVDEAYVEFASAEAAPPDAGDAAALNALSLVPAALACERENVLVTRTMSKAFGLAALRVGYAVGPAALVAALGVAVSPKGFNPLASAVAREALRNLGHYRAAARAARKWAAFAVRALRERGWWALDTPANFYLVYVGDAARAVGRLAAAGVQARDRDELPGLAGFVRITAGTADDGETVLAAFGQPLSLPQPGLPLQAFYTDKGTVAAVKTLARRALAALAGAGVTVWAQGGTMLGLYRHRRREGGAWRGGMIPWDDDVDLAYLRADDGGDPLAPHVARFAEAGLTLQRNRTGAYWQIGTNAAGEVISPVHVDVFSYSRVELVSALQFRLGDERFQGGGGIDVATHPAIERTTEVRYLLDDERFREEEPGSPQAHCNTSYAHDELFPLSDEYFFYDVRLLMPAQPEAVLRRALGPDFLQTARVRRGGGSLEFALRDTTPA